MNFPARNGWMEHTSGNFDEIMLETASSMSPSFTELFSHWHWLLVELSFWSIALGEISEIAGSGSKLEVMETIKTWTVKFSTHSESTDCFSDCGTNPHGRNPFVS